MTGPWDDVVLMSDPRVTGVPVHDDGAPLVDSHGRLPFDGRQDDGTGVARLMRGEVLERLCDAASALPADLRLVLNEAYRRPEEQQRIFERYADTLRDGLRTPEQVHHLASRHLSPPEVAPHPAGAAVDVLLTTPEGAELDLGCPIDATPEESRGRCYTHHPDVSGEARLLREQLVAALGAAGLVNYPTEWWHWSYGDRYWAMSTGNDRARFGTVWHGRRRP